MLKSLNDECLQQTAISRLCMESLHKRKIKNVVSEKQNGAKPERSTIGYY